MTAIGFAKWLNPFYDLSFGANADYGPGYRVCFAERHGIVVILLRGGTKKTQQQDIKEAKRIYKEWKDQK
jgi:putative addiction module killer protein